MKSQKTLMMLGGLVLAGLVTGAAAQPAKAQCYNSGYYVGSPVYVAPSPVYLAPAPVVVQAPVVYAPPVRYFSTYVGYSGGYRHYYARHHVYRHHGHRGSSWGFGFHYNRH